MAACLASACLLGPSRAFAQSTFFYGGGTRTWSTAANWWQNFLGTTPAGAAPTANDTAVFNVSGQTAGTVVLTNDASVNRLLTLPTATGGLTIRSDGTTRSLTLGPGGILVQSGSLALGSTTAGQGLNVVLAGSQNWRLGGQSLTVNGTVSGTSATGGSQTLFIDRANGLAGTPVFTNGTAGGGLNVWFNNAAAANFTLAASSTISSLTLQNATASVPGIPAGSYPGIGELRIAGYGFGTATAVTVSLNPSGTVRFLGGSSSMRFQSSVLNAGVLVRQPGEGIFNWGDGTTTFTGIPSATLVDGILPWVTGVRFTTLSGSSLAQAYGGDVANINSTPTSGTIGNYAT
ncbi:MAG: hypothetical protein ACKONH_12405, partial [Planctomycetia bacterium]